MFFHAFFAVFGDFGSIFGSQNPYENIYIYIYVFVGFSIFEKNNPFVAKKSPKSIKNDQKGSQNGGKVAPGGPGSPKKQIFETIEKQRKKEAKKRKNKKRFRIEPDLAGERKAHFESDEAMLLSAICSWNLMV